MVRIFFIVLLIIGFIEALKTIPLGLGIIPPEVPNETIPVVPRQIQPTSNFFSKEGTLVFYPNNVGPVPYLYYSDANHHLATKGLIFTGGSKPRDLEAWAGSRIAVEGQVDHSSVIVSSIFYIAGP